MKFSDYGSRLFGTDVIKCIFQLQDVFRQQDNKEDLVGTDVRHYDSGNVRLSLHPKPRTVWRDLEAPIIYLRDFPRQWDCVVMQFSFSKPKNTQVLIGFFSAISAEE